MARRYNNRPYNTAIPLHGNQPRQLCFCANTYHASVCSCKAISQAHTLNCTTQMWRRKQLRIVCLQSKRWIYVGMYCNIFKVPL